MNLVFETRKGGGLRDPFGQQLHYPLLKDSGSGGPETSEGGDVEESQPGPAFVGACDATADIEDLDFPEIEAEQRGEPLSLLAPEWSGNRHLEVRAPVSSLR